MGEDLGNGDFRVVDISVQRSGGTEVCFIRNPNEHQAELDAFFTRTGKDYRRFNYLGEWHSHPDFDVVPSGRDIATMLSLINDSTVGSNFLVLVVARLSGKKVEATASVFTREAMPFCISLTTEHEGKMQEWSLVSKWIKKIFRV